MKIEQIIPYQFFFPVFEAYKSIKLQLQLGKIPHKTRPCQYRNAGLAISLLLNCFSGAEEENCVDENMNGNVEYSE